MWPEEVKKRRTKTPDEALAALKRLCARAEKCESDALRLMRGWGVADADARRVLARLVAERFIDDGRYAAAFVREKLNLSSWGAYKIRTALRRKGVAAAHIDRALEGADPESMEARLRNQLERKARTLAAADASARKAKLIRYGLSLGYDFADVLEAATSVAGDATAEEEFWP